MDPQAYLSNTQEALKSKLHGATEGAKPAVSNRLRFQIAGGSVEFTYQSRE